MGEVILSIDELAPREPTYVEVLGERYAVRPPEELDLIQISRIEWLASFVGRGKGIQEAFETSHEFARAVRDLLVPSLPDDVLDRLAPSQAYGFAVNVLVWALGEVGRQIPPLLPVPAAGANGSISASSSPGSSASTGGGRKTG